MVRLTSLVAFLLLLLVIVAVTANAQTAQRRILLEEFSTAQCGFCPDGEVIASKIVRDHPSVIWVTHHAGFGTDSMTALHSPAIAGAFVNFAPSGVIDRVKYPKHVAPYENLGNIRSKWDSLVTAHLGDEQYAEIRIVSTYRAPTQQLECAVEVEFSAVPATGDLRLHLFVIEDSIVGAGKGYDQTNYFNSTAGHKYYGAGDPILGYAHHRVVSAIPTGAWGVEEVIPRTPETGKVYTWNWTGDMNAIWDKNNLGRHDIISLVAFVSYYDSDPFRRAVVHAGEAPITNLILDVPNAPAVPGTLELAVYPNPASSHVTVTAALAPAEHGRLIVTDAAGREVAIARLDAGNPRLALSTAALPAGIYFTRLMTGTRIAAGKFLVRH
jgi:hypothetical protein